MKRLIFFIICTMTLLFCAVPVYATDYNIEALQLDLTAPEDWTTFIRDIKPSSKELSKLDTDYWSLWQYFKNNDIYLLTISEDDTATILLRKYQNDQPDLLLQLQDDPKSLKKKQIDALMAQYKKNHSEDITYTDWELYLSAQQCNYLVFEYHYDSGGQRVYCRQYITAYDGQCLDLTLVSYSKITPDYKAAQKEMIDSIALPASLEVSPKSDAASADDFSPEQSYTENPTQSQPVVSETDPASTTAYSIDALQIGVQLPSNWLTLIKGLPPQQDALDRLEMDQETLSEYFERNQSYLVAISDDGATEITLSKYDDHDTEFLFVVIDYPENVLQEEAQRLLEKYQKKHPENTYTGWQLYTSKNLDNYFVFQYWYDRNGQRIYGQQYVTEYEEQCLAVTLESSGNEIPALHAAVQKNVIDTMFDPALLKPSLRAQGNLSQTDSSFSEAASARAIDYTIKPLRLDCSIPSNWITIIKDLEPEQEALDLLDMDQETVSEYLERNQSYLLSFSDDAISEMALEAYHGPSTAAIMMYAKGYEKSVEEDVIELMTNYQAQYPGITFTGWDFFTAENQFECLVLQYWYDLQNQRVYCQQYITNINGQNLALTLRSYGSEITAESAAVQKELANSFYVNERNIMTPEQSGALAATITIDILFTWLFIHFILNKISAWLKKKRGWTAELEGKDMAYPYEEKECLKKARYELRVNFILGFMYFIASYFYLLLFIVNTGGYLIQIAGISGYGFRALMKTRKESITIIDHILSEAYPEKKKSYRMLLMIIMLLFQFLLFLPLLFVIFIVGFILYLFLLSLR